MLTTKIFYINLDERTDRREHMEKLLKGYNYERFSAFKTDRGYFGCVKSHIRCLKLARERGLENVIILEDDFTYRGKTELKDILIPENYDMLLLCNLIINDDVLKQDDNFKRVVRAEWTSGHCVNKRFYDILIDTFEKSLEQLEEKYCRNNYLDIYWNRIFKDHIVLTHNNMMGIQMESYSDVKNKMMNRKNTF